MLLSPIKVYLITETSKNSMNRVFRGAFITLPYFVLPLRENFVKAADIAQQPLFNPSYFTISE
jgi:hypothetical protein